MKKHTAIKAGIVSSEAAVADAKREYDESERYLKQNAEVEFLSSRHFSIVKRNSG